MTLLRGRTTLPKEGGFALIEVLISGVIVVIASTGIVALMQASVHSAGDQRNRSQSYSLAQEDQARLRALRIPTLRVLAAKEGGEENKITVEGTTYEVLSKAAFVNAVSEGVPTCGAGESSADYVKVSSQVTWKNMSPTKPTVISSIIATPTATLAPRSGMLAISIVNAAGVGIPTIGLSGTRVGGGGSFSGSTDSNGCAIFFEQPEGEYTLKFSGGPSSLVDQDGSPIGEKTITVNPETTTSVSFTYDSAGSVPFRFKTTNYKSEPEDAEAENLIAFNSLMKSGAKIFTFTKRNKFEVTSLFPFTSTDNFYTGSCVKNEPTSGTGLVSVLVPMGTKAAEQTLTMPALLLSVKKEGTATNGIAVKVTDNECGVIRSYTTASVSSTAGRLSTPELPWSTYTVCAWTSITTGSGSQKKTRPYRLSETFPVHELKTEKTFNITTKSPSVEGEC